MRADNHEEGVVGHGHLLERFGDTERLRKQSSLQSDRLRMDLCIRCLAEGLLLQVAAKEADDRFPDGVLFQLPVPGAAPPE